VFGGGGVFGEGTLNKAERRSGGAAERRSGGAAERRSGGAAERRIIVAERWSGGAGKAVRERASC